MALWNEDTKPQWLLGVDGTGTGLGTNAIVDNNDTPNDDSDDITGNELGTVEKDPAIGWKQWHSKEGSWDGTPGSGRGWFEILATQDINGIPVATSAATAVVAAEGGTFTVSASDINGDTLTYSLVTAGGCTIDGVTGVVTSNGTPGDITWNVSDGRGGTFASDVTVTISNA